ncbi:MAG: DUF721 domain-containing protein [Pseudomonadota bacterium]|nr:DUF721 domain-containing protein [Gammaproteobacteria bacterium]MBU1926719.1 DUF721 domain-containing protein [Gammaproteobacteria bacterium]MBU2545632.1 DUF721 domain-containing protein [Gammaproteobacteria bacterium]
MQQTMNKQKKLAMILRAPKNQLAKLVGKVNQITYLNQQFVRFLAPQMAKHCQLANYENDRLVVLIDHANWAMQFRFLIPELLKQLAKEEAFKGIKAIEYKVRLKTVTPPEKKRQISKLSSQTIQLIKSTANSMTDKNLKKALMKLAKEK